MTTTTKSKRPSSRQSQSGGLSDDENSELAEEKSQASDEYDIAFLNAECLVKEKIIDGRSEIVSMR